MVRTNQGGSILGFIVVGVVLTLLLIGGVWVVHNKAQLAGQTTEPESSQPQASDQSGKESEKSKKPNSSQSSGSTSNSSESESANRSQSAGSGSSEPSKSSGQSESSSSSTQSQSSSGSREGASQSTAAELPHTGPAETAMSIVAVGMLVFVAGVYIRSRRLDTSL